VSFKIGDTIEVVNIIWEVGHEDYSFYIGEIGIIKYIDKGDKYPYFVTFNNLDEDWFFESEINLIEQPYKVYKKEKGGHSE